MRNTTPNPTTLLIKPQQPLQPILTRPMPTQSTSTNQPTPTNKTPSIQINHKTPSTQDHTSDHQSLSSQRSSSWWSWLSVSSTQPIPSELPQDVPSPSAIPPNSNHPHSSPDGNFPDATTTDRSSSYISRVGTWAYSWIGETPTSQPPQTDSNQPDSAPVPTLIDSLPNPVVSSIPLSGQGWASYFSSRRSLPIHKVKQTRDNQSVESMPVEFSSPESSHSQALPQVKTTTTTNALKTRPQSVIDLSKNWFGIKNSNLSSVDEPAPKLKPSYQIQTNNFPDPSSSSTATQHQSNIAPMTDDLSPQTVSQIMKGKRVIPNLVLPTFEDTFNHPPRSFLPRPSKLQKTLELVQAFIYSNPPPPQYPQVVPNETIHHLSKRKKRAVLEILEDNRHISTKLPKSLDLLGINRTQRLENVRRVTIIGIHGWFPGPWLESVLGKPTGTSNKFTTMMDMSVRRYIEKESGEELNQDFTSIINLIGEGKVDDRVENLYKQLILNNNNNKNLDILKNSDVVFIVSHSQGCLVSCKLLDKLLSSFNFLIPDKFLSLSMCGIWNGPYLGLNTNFALQPVLKFFEGPAAHELFEFQDPHSPASKAVMKSLKNTLRLGVKYVLIGSMNDQVVPIYSSINHLIDHPSILRAMFIDSDVYYSSTDFLTNLVVFCLRLRNSGFSDHGLLFLLSDYLVGSLMGVGHSTIYEDRNVFDLAVRYFFETSTPLESPTYYEEPEGKKKSSNKSNVVLEEEGSTSNEVEQVVEGMRKKSLPDKLSIIDHSMNPRGEKPNPFLLTWSLRGLIEDYKIRLLFHNELIFLKNSFLAWNPSASTVSNYPPPSENGIPNNPRKSGVHSIPPSKILKDLKIKLEPFREVRLD